MIRTMGLRLLLIALPFALYGLYLLLIRLTPATRSRPHPWTWLFITGLTLFAASFVVWGLTEGETTKGVYVAPHVVNGRIVPGHVETGP